MQHDGLLGCAYASQLPASGAPEWVQLFPLGDFTAVDGRKFSVGDAEKVIAASKASLPALIDYDHGAERPPDASLNSGAAGWIVELAAQGPAHEKGIWAKVEWTPKGAQAVADKEYRYLSPSFMHSKSTKAVARILRAALTNTPAFRDLIKAIASTQQENDVDLKSLAAALGLPDTATEQDVLAAIAALRSGQTSMCASLKTIALASGLPEARAANPGDADVVAICAKLKGGGNSAGLQAQVDDLQKQLASLTKAARDGAASADVEAAIAAGKLAPAQKDWALDYAARDPAGFKAFAGSAPVIVRGNRIAPESGTGADGELSEDEKSICAALGLKEDEFKKELAAARKKKEAQ